MERRVYSAKMRRLAAQAYKRHPMQLCLWVLEQIALRAVALSPLYIALRLGYSMTAALILCLALYLLMIYPLRFRAALTLTRMVRLTDASGLCPASYPARVGAGALRLLLGGGQPCRGLLVILPAAFSYCPARVSTMISWRSARFWGQPAKKCKWLLAPSCFSGSFLCRFCCFSMAGGAALPTIFSW